MTDPVAVDSRQARSAVLRRLGADGDVLDELLAYTINPFTREGSAPEFPLPDEPHIDRWRLYENEAGDMGAFEALKRRFVQLRFPIRDGISADESYRRATRKGKFAEADAFAPGLMLKNPGGVELTLCPTIAGTVPVIVVSDRDDFVSVVRAYSERNEPARVPDSLGACIVTGFNNWDRIAAYREAWAAGQGDAATEDAWQEEFRGLMPRKELYQDRFVILSRGPYSATPADAIGFAQQDWLSRSLVIRREHEFTHYFTYRVFGAMRNNVLDELIADFVGLVRSFGTYRPDLARHFFGLESYPAYRESGRLETYRGKPPLSDDAFKILRRMAYESVANLDRVASVHRDRLGDLGGLGRLTYALCGFGLDDLASPDLPQRLNASALR
jgi:hypothetical protein